MIVAVTAVRVMQMIPDTVIGVAAMRHRFVSATRSMDMSRVVAAAAVTGRAAIRVVGRHLDHVFVDVAVMRVMQMPLVQVIGMPVMPHGRMAAAGTVLVGMAGMLLGSACRHSSFLFSTLNVAGNSRSRSSQRDGMARYWSPADTNPFEPGETPGSCRSARSNEAFSPPG